MMFPQEIYYESNALSYPLGKMMYEKYKDVPWIEIQNHNNITQLRQHENYDFPKLKQKLIIGIRKTHRYVENHKVSDYLVPYTSSGCSAMCLYCYLVCNYNKCSYLRIFVNREQMLEKLIKKSQMSDNMLTFEIGSNSDLVLENTITENLEWTIKHFAQNGRGNITLPTKFDMVEPLLDLDHKGKTIFRMSVNPEEIIRKIEIGTSQLGKRIIALNKMCDAGYPVGILIAPVIMVDNWKDQYSKLIDRLSQELSPKVKKSAFIEIIFMTYSFVQNAINKDAFPGTIDLHDREKMTGRGRGKYCYRDFLREDGEIFFRDELARKLPDISILYVV